MIFGSLGLTALAVLGAPLFLIIAGVALLGFMTHGRPPADVTGEIAKLVQMDTLITIPLFTFAGYLLAQSGAPRRLVAVSRALFGWMPGGMAIVTVIACAFFTTFTGASGITIVALGGLLLPMLLQQKYPRDFALGVVTTSGSRGLIFPPSLPVIIYGYVAAVDITRLYIAGIVPGMLGLMLVILWCVKTGLFAHVPRTPFDPKGAAVALWKALPEVLLPVWLIGLILTAVLKVPEAAAIAALYVLVVEVVIYRDIHPLKDLPRITKESMVLCGAILVIIAASLGLTNFMVDQRVPELLVKALRETISSKWAFLLALNGFLLVVGCLMDIFSAIVIVVPLLLPLAAEYGVHPVHLAIIFLVNLEIGYSTPPVGMNLFISSFFFRQPIVRLYRVAIPFLILALVGLFAVTYIEPLATFTVPAGGATVKGGMKGPEPARKGAAPGSGSGASSQPAKGKPTIDGICDPKLKGDPDCEDIDVDLDDDKPEKKKGADGEGSPGAKKQGTKE
jgi:tripartite ATP-independent transporter DctM subunit